jgi:hypothetical protein
MKRTYSIKYQLSVASCFLPSLFNNSLKLACLLTQHRQKDLETTRITLHMSQVREINRSTLSITLCWNYQTGDSNVSAFLSIDISLNTQSEMSWYRYSDCDVTLVILPNQEYYIRWTGSLPRMAVTVRGNAKYWRCCDKRLYFRQSRAEYNVASREAHVTR